MRCNDVPDVYQPTHRASLRLPVIERSCEWLTFYRSWTPQPAAARSITWTINEPLTGDGSHVMHRILALGCDGPLAA